MAPAKGERSMSELPHHHLLADPKRQFLYKRRATWMNLGIEPMFVPVNIVMMQLALQRSAIALVLFSHDRQPL
jgi:hypothetical protein